MVIAHEPRAGFAPGNRLLIVDALPIVDIWNNCACKQALLDFMADRECYVHTAQLSEILLCLRAEGGQASVNKLENALIDMNVHVLSGFDVEMADLVADIRVPGQRTGHPMPLAVACCGCVAKLMGADLLTRNGHIRIDGVDVYWYLDHRNEPPHKSS